MTTTAADLTIFIGDEQYEDEFIKLYEKTSTTYEEVAGLIGSAGTAAHQVKIYVANAKPSFIFDRQTSWPGINSSVEDADYATDGKPVNGRSWGPWRFRGVLNDGNTITRGMGLQPEAATGKLDKWTTGYLCAIAQEAVTASGSDENIKCVALLDMVAPERIVTETITVSVASCTVTLAPIAMISHLEATAGATISTGGLNYGSQSTPADSRDAKVNYTTGACSFLAADGISQVHIRYTYRG